VIVRVDIRQENVIVGVDIRRENVMQADFVLQPWPF
jgi:hypothetical protein